MTLAIPHVASALSGGAAQERSPASEQLLAGRHIPALDAIRGLAILMVTYYRFGGGSPEYASAGDGLPLHEIGSRGVELFFVLSGFLITGILYDSKDQPHFFRNFYARRTLRIFPLYYGVLLLGLVLLPAMSSAAASWYVEAREQQAWLWFYGANVLQSWRGAWSLGWFNHFWSLAIEEHYYLLWPMVVFFLSRKQALVACGALFALSAGSRVAWVLLGGNDVAPEVFTLFRLDAIVLGSALALLVRGPLGLRGLVKPAIAGVALSLPVLIGVSLLDRRVFTIPESFWAIFFGAAIILVLAAREGGMIERAGRSRVLRFFGKYSYGMYVFQSLLIPVMAGVVTATGLAASLGSPLLGQLAYLLIMFAATTGMALLSWHAYEKHFLKLKSRFEARRPAATQMQLSPALSAVSASVPG
jgi:peptidoglycan/LPS O-acetylase OafA/YrhL